MNKPRQIAPAHNSLLPYTMGQSHKSIQQIQQSTEF